MGSVQVTDIDDPSLSTASPWTCVWYRSSTLAKRLLSANRSLHHEWGLSAAHPASLRTTDWRAGCGRSA